MYQAGFFPVMMFGLPAAAIAIYQSARPERKKQVGTILLSAAFASFVTGVTEPLELSLIHIFDGAEYPLNQYFLQRQDPLCVSNQVSCEIATITNSKPIVLVKSKDA